eukprot:6175824-Pleurochrysis_carterae.AAC.2
MAMRPSALARTLETEPAPADARVSAADQHAAHITSFRRHARQSAPHAAGGSLDSSRAGGDKAAQCASALCVQPLHLEGTLSSSARGVAQAQLLSEQAKCPLGA